MLVHQLIYQGEDEQIFFHGDTDISCGHVRTEVARYRIYLYNAGVRQGENVGLLARNSPAFIYAYMAIASLGAIVVPINYQLTAQEVAFIVKDAQMKNLVITKTMDLTTPLSNNGYFTEVAQHVIEQIDDFSVTQEPLGLSFDTEISEDQPCAIIYTSGTTGNPKGAVLTHRNLVSDAACFSKAMPVYETDNILCILPLYHCLAWTCIILCSLLHKASVTIVDTIVPKDVIEGIKRFGVTVMYGVPSVYMLLLKTAEPGDLARLRLFMSGGASLPQQVAEDFQRKFGTSITEGYGLSEASPVVATNPQHRPKPLSIGKPIPGVEVQIVNPQGEAEPTGVVGELTVRGPNVMQGYFNLPNATAQALRGGWLHTGDLAYQDDEGYLFIVDRLKDLIITSGENIYRREIEELLYRYPGVSEAAVVGLPDNLRGQVACAYIVMAEGQILNKKVVKNYLRDKVAAYKIPRDYIQVDHLPKNQSGKIMKRSLREQHKR
ncbi:long-chain fatty acid--CoA ligase [Anaerosporomusa subterranea]|uniref:Long-chain fatty acid--CoA ligase n=1 Tax=Anaerosporomusa subterranea TaxID=1794912 RepID=A0A154BP32_ANASB|nr:AMP-binding protein [Anaerosporomusa subterranea]KYZ75610.1 long-chain fatty acid--CoA ligase [Anaerosporomusa subterranea]